MLDDKERRRRSVELEKNGGGSRRHGDEWSMFLWM